MPPDVADLILQRLNHIDKTLDDVRHDVRAFAPDRCFDHGKRLTSAERRIEAGEAIRRENQRIVAAGWARLSVLVTIAGAAGGIVVALIGG